MRSKVDSQIGSVLDSQPDIRKPTTSASQGSQRLMTWACATKWARKPSPPAPHSLPGPVPRASENQVAVICSESDGERDMDGVSCLSLQRIGRSVGNPCGERNEKALSFLSRRENEMNAASGRTFRCCAAKGRAFRRPKADRSGISFSRRFRRVAEFSGGRRPTGGVCGAAPQSKVRAPRGVRISGTKQKSRRVSAGFLRREGDSNS